VDGRQYVAIASGANILSFALPESETPEAGKGRKQSSK
jgi:hypothetical protein